MSRFPAILVENGSITLFLRRIQSQVHFCRHHMLTFRAVAACLSPLRVTRHPPFASSPPPQLVPPTLPQNAKPGPGVIAAQDSSWHKCWHSVGITCNNVCRLHPSKAIIITSRREIGYSLAWFLGASFTFGAGSFRKWRRKRRDETLECTPGNRAAGWPVWAAGCVWKGSGPGIENPGWLCYQFDISL